MSAEHVGIEVPRLLRLSRAQGMGDRLFGEVERRLVRRQPQARPLDQADELLADQVMPESALDAVAIRAK